MEFLEKKDVKICIIMLGLFGDVLFRTPILRSIKKKYPNANITVIVDKIGYDVLYNNPNINHIIVMNRKKTNYIKYLYSKISTQIKIIIEKFDIVIDLYNGSSSRSMAKLSLSKYIIAKEPSKLPYKFNNEAHFTSRLFQGLSKLNLDRQDMSVDPEFFINSKVQNRILSEVKNLKKDKFYLLSLGSGGLEKILDIHKTYEIVKYLNHHYGFKPIIVANPGQEFLQERLINDYLEPNGIKFVKLGIKSIDEIAIFIKHSTFFIVPDTGLLHLSFSLKTPTFCVFTHTHPLYVQPENDIIYGIAYKLKEPEEFDSFGLRHCTQDINFSEIKQNLDDFISKVLEQDNV
ncbi:glycosyltransferase family 9 protein [Campylobacter suis]|uniref:Glycosyltransferase family 9 protein n=1 Tax=Campylobacter suis TaxID=2790657 RepID=A0ABM8Q0Y0_9BACT|nr:glycosyltransferase family 9 protein [Campylobacter suis]CAD7286475.1 hypothetical protein LMG8286_00308 [Campylobacter suis]